LIPPTAPSARLSLCHEHLQLPIDRLFAAWNRSPLPLTVGCLEQDPKKGDIHSHVCALIRGPQPQVQLPVIQPGTSARGYFYFSPTVPHACLLSIHTLENCTQPVARSKTVPQRRPAAAWIAFLRPCWPVTDTVRPRPGRTGKAWRGHATARCKRFLASTFCPSSPRDECQGLAKQKHPPVTCGSSTST
jgi:hypothetical protein